VEGRAQVVYTEYTVTVDVVGPLDEPRLELSSIPPLPERDLWSVLIFGRPLKALDAQDTESVGNLQAAAADGALGLASMYALASTPVESVGYNPITKQFQARLRLTDGTSLVLNSDFKALNEIGLRQRLGKNWSIRTYIENPFEENKKTSLNTYLEWSLSY
jgi:hypothetical protein